MKRWTFDVFIPGSQTETLTYYSHITAAQVRRLLIEAGYPANITIRRVR